MATLKQDIVDKLETYKDLFDNALDLIHVVEPDGTIIYVNNAWEELLGYTQAEIQGKSIYSVIHHTDRDRFRQHRGNVITRTAVDSKISVGMVARNGSILYVEGFVSSRVIDDQTLYTRGIFRDITSRLHAEAQLKSVYEKLKENESNLQQLFVHAPDAIIVVDIQSRITYWNPKAENIFGWTVREVLGKPLTQVIIPERYREAHESGMKRYLSSGEQRVLNKTIEITALNKSSKEFYVALTISATHQNGKPAFVAFIRDIEEQKRNADELEQKRVQLERSNQQLEQFAHVASHDMKEPIRKIVMFTGRVQADTSNILSDDSKNYLLKIEKAAARLTEMVDGVLAYSSLKAEDLVTQKVDLNDVIKNIITDLELVVQQKKAVINYKDLPTIRCAPILIFQLLYNLINNSLKFSKPGVTPEIEVTASRISPLQANEYYLNAQTSYFEITVKDNGIGFSQEHAETIFKTFSRLNSKDKFEGTGLGLSLCKTIVEKHNGIIKAYGIENVGATFLVVLPE